MAKILVVEDFEDSRFSLCRLLEMSGHVVVEAVDGESAVEVAQTEKPEIILMDLSLPLIDGLEATRRIRALDVTPRMSIVACSAHDTTSIVNDAYAAGCDAYVTKPIDFDELESVIGRFAAS